MEADLDEFLKRPLGPIPPLHKNSITKTPLSASANAIEAETTRDFAKRALVGYRRAKSARGTKPSLRGRRKEYKEASPQNLDRFRDRKGWVRCLISRPESSTSMDSARDTLGRPGMSIMFPAMTTTNPAPADKRCVRDVERPAGRSAETLGLSVREIAFSRCRRVTGHTPRGELFELFWLAR